MRDKECKCQRDNTCFNATASFFQFGGAQELEKDSVQISRGIEDVIKGDFSQVGEVSSHIAYTNKKSDRLFDLKLDLMKNEKDKKIFTPLNVTQKDKFYGSILELVSKNPKLVLPFFNMAYKNKEKSAEEILQVIMNQGK